MIYLLQAGPSSDSSVIAANVESAITITICLMRFDRHAHANTSFNKYISMGVSVNMRGS